MSRKQQSYSKKDAVYQGTQVVPNSVLATEDMMPSMPPPSTDPSLPVLRVLNVPPSNSGMPIELKEEVKQEVKQEGSSSLKREADQDTEDVSESKIPKTKPSSDYPDWFLRSSVHSLEKIYMSEFFDGSSPQLNPASYVSMRNFIMDEYLLTPNNYLSSTACRKKLPGDARTVIAVHDFLDSFSLINYAVSANARPARVPLLLAPPNCFIQPESDSWTPIPSSPPLDDEMKKRLIVAVGECAPGDWSKVAELMGGKLSSSECIQHFVSLPLEVPGSPSSKVRHTYRRHDRAYLIVF